MPLSRLPTVRAKLVALVGLSALGAVVALPVLAWMTHASLDEAVTERLALSEQAFTSELEDDLSDVTVAAHTIAESGAARRAIAEHDPVRGLASLKRVGESWADFDLLLFDADGALLAQLGCQQPRLALTGLLAKARDGAWSGVAKPNCNRQGYR